MPPQLMILALRAAAKGEAGLEPAAADLDRLTYLRNP